MKKWWIIIGVVILIGLGFITPGVKDILFAPADMVDAVSTGVEIKQIETMIMGFKKENNRWPTESEFDELKNSHFSRDRDDNLKANSLVDMWGEPYNYFREGSGFVLISVGPDKKPNTTDDVILLRRN